MLSPIGKLLSKNEPLRKALLIFSFIGFMAVSSGLEAAPENKLEFSASENGFNISELSEAGESFFAGFFRRGWPTNRQTKAVTVYDATGSAADALCALLVSEAGLKLADSAYIEAVRSAGLRKGGDPWSIGRDVVETKLMEFAKLAKYNGDRNFAPLLFEFGQATPNYNGRYNNQSLRSQSWDMKAVNKTMIMLEGVASIFYAQAKFAREQLLEKSHKSTNGRRVIENFGSDPQSAFFALVCLQNALAKLMELKTRCIYFNNTNGSFKKWDSYDLRGPDAWFPHRLKVRKTNKALEYSVDPKDKNGRESDLYEQAMILRGCNELFKIVQFAHKSTQAKFKSHRLVKTLFTSQKFPGMNDYPFMPNALELVTDVALLVVANMQRMHFDVNRRTMRSRSSEAPELENVQLLIARDIGVTLLALSDFLQGVNELSEQFKGTQTALKNRLRKKRRYATTCLKYLTTWLLARIQTRKALFDRYNIATHRELEPETSSLSIGLVIRGLLATAKLSDNDLDSDTRETATKHSETLMFNAERQLWNNAKNLYIGRQFKASKDKPISVQVSGQIAMLSALKDMAEQHNDIRFLIRFTNLMEALKANRFIYSETKRGGERGNDSDNDGIHDPSSTGIAPVYRTKIMIK